MSFLSGYKDTDLLILSKLNDKDLLSICLANKEANRLCKNEDFWRNRFISRFGEKDFHFSKKIKTRSWRNYYLLLIKYLNLDLGNNNFSRRGMIQAVIDGNKDLVEFFIHKGIKDLDYGMFIAAENNNKDLVDFFIEKGAKNWDFGLQGAAQGGNKELVDFFIEKGARDYLNALKHAEEGGHKKLEKYILNRFMRKTIFGRWVPK
jgi:hypothetical protein